MFKPSHYSIRWYPWFCIQVYCTFHQKNFHTRAGEHLPLKPTFSLSGHDYTKIHHFRSQFGGLCQKIQWGTFLAFSEDGQVWHSAQHNSKTCPPKILKPTFSESPDFSLQYCQRKFKNCGWSLRNQLFQIAIWPKNTTFPENKKIVDALEHLLFGTKNVISNIGMCNSKPRPRSVPPTWKISILCIKFIINIKLFQVFNPETSFFHLMDPNSTTNNLLSQNNDTSYHETTA